MTQQAKPPFSYRVLDQVLGVSLPTHLTCNVLGKAAQDGPSAGDPALRWEIEATSSWIQMAPAF